MSYFPLHWFYKAFSRLPVDIRELTTNLHILYIFPSQPFLVQVRKRRHLEQSQLTSRQILEHGPCFKSHTRSWCLWFARNLTGFWLLHWCRLRFHSGRPCSVCAIPPVFRVSDYSSFVFCVTSWLVQASENVLQMFARTKSLRLFFATKLCRPKISWKITEDQRWKGCPQGIAWSK